MKKIILLGLTLLLLAMSFSPILVSAVQIRPGETPPMVEILPTITRITNILFWLLLTFAVIFFILGAYYFLVGGVNPDVAKKGKGIIIGGIIALVVAFLARGIVPLIQTILGTPVT